MSDDLITKKECDKCKDNMSEKIDKLTYSVGTLTTDVAVIRVKIENIEEAISNRGRISFGFSQTILSLAGSAAMGIVIVLITYLLNK
jgi:hypothetical protein